MQYNLPVSVNEAITTAIAKKVAQLAPDIAVRLGDETFSKQFLAQKYSITCFHERTTFAIEDESLYSTKWNVQQIGTVYVSITSLVFDVRSQVLSLRLLEHVLSGVIGYQPYHYISPVYAVEYGQLRTYGKDDGSTAFVGTVAIGNVPFVNGGIDRLTPTDQIPSTNPVAIIRFT